MPGCQILHDTGSKSKKKTRELRALPCLRELRQAYKASSAAQFNRFFNSSSRLVTC
jgi:hypothetical protein